MGRETLCTAGGLQAGAASLENSMEVPQKAKNRTTLRPSNCTTRYLSKGYRCAVSFFFFFSFLFFFYRCAVSKGHMDPHVYSSTINNSQSMERAQCPSMDEWIKKMWYIYTMEYYSATKKNEILPFATMWMELECIMLSKISQSEKDKYHMVLLMCEI